MSPEELLKLAEAFEKEAFDFMGGDPLAKEQIATKEIMEIKYKIASLKGAMETISRNLVMKKSLSFIKRFLINRKLNQIESNIRDIFSNLK